MSWLTEMKKNKNIKTISNEEALKDVEPYFTEDELEKIRKDDVMMYNNYVVDIVCCGYHTVVDASLDNFLRSFKTDDGNFFVIGKGNILNPCDGFETVTLPVSQCMIYEMKREDLNKANTNK